MAEVKGTKITSKLEFVRQRYGAEALERVLAALPPAHREAVAHALPIGWYDLAAYDELVESICKVAAQGDTAVYDLMGADSAERQMGTVYGAYLKQDLLRTIENMVPMHGQLNRPAEMRVERAADGSGPGHACTIVVRAPRSTAAGCRVSRAFYRRVAELSGVRDVSVAESTCTSRGDDACRFHLRWSA